MTTLAQQISYFYAKHVIQGAKLKKQRTGERLFYSLPAGAGNAIASTLIDPYHFDFGEDELVQWVDNHLVLDDYFNVLAVFNGNQILWEKGNDGSK